jgi:WD40 repeat protein
MSGKLVVKHSFGLNPVVKNCLAFSEDHHLAYSSGHQVCVLNTESKDQSFINLGNNSALQHYTSLGVTAIACSGPKKVIAVADKSDPVAIVTFFDSHSLRKKKTLLYSELGSKEINCIAFSDDGKFCCTQGIGPEWNLVLWNVEKTPKLLAVLKICLSDDTPVHQISFCPWDPSVILVLGKSIIRLLRFTEGQLRPSFLSVRRDNANFLSHSWLSDDHLVVGTESGEIFLIEDLEFRGIVYPTGNVSVEEVTPILSMVATSRGFVMGTVNGELRIFEKNEEIKEQYQFEDSLFIPPKKGNIVVLTMGSDDTLVCGTDTQQLYQISMNSIIHNKENNGFDFLHTSYHGPNEQGEAAITGIDVALWKPIVVTCGKDKSVRVWNTSDRKIEIMKFFDEEPCCLSVHPSGLYVAIGFSDKILLVSILLDDLFQSHSISSRNLSVVKYSHGGHFLVVANGSNIQIHNSYTGASVCTLRGHSNKIKSLFWLNNDSRILSIGADGSVYFWNLFPAGRRSEGFSGTGILFHAGGACLDGSKAYAATSDKTIKEICFQRTVDPTTGVEGSIKEPFDIDIGHHASQVVMDDSRKIVMVGTDDGNNIPSSIITMMSTPQISTNFDKTIIHSSPVTAMCMAYDGSFVFSGDMHGCLCVSEFETDVLGAKSNLKQREGLISFDFVDEVVIHKANLESKKSAISDLTNKVEELTLNNEHQLRLKEMEHKDKVQDISKKFESQLSAELVKFVALSEEKKDVENLYDDKMKNLAIKQSGELTVVDIKYKTKLTAESNRHKLLLSETEIMHKRWNEENVSLVESHQSYLQEMTEDYEDKLRNEQHMQKKIQKEKEFMVIDFDTVRTDIESDADFEVDDIKNKYQLRLKNEEETGLELMAQHALMKKNLQMISKDSDQQKEDIKRLKDKEIRLLETIKSLEKDIQSHKKEIREREETITDKEKRIFDLKKKNQELEKFRFVLDYKIKELKLQIAPRENEIATMRKQIEEMDLELEQYHRSNLSLNLMIGELKLKLDGVGKELASQEERVDINHRLIDKYRRDLKDIWDIRNVRLFIVYLLIY